MDERVIEISVEPELMRAMEGEPRPVRFIRIRVDGWTYASPVDDQNRIDDLLINAGHTLKRHLAQAGEEKENG